LHPVSTFSLRVEQGDMTKNIYHDIHLKICDNNITDDIIDTRQYTLQLHNFISEKKINVFSLKQAAVFFAFKLYKNVTVQMQIPC